MKLFTRKRSAPAAAAAPAEPVAEQAYDEPELSAPQRQLLDDLRARGIATVGFDELFADPGLWESMQADMDAFVGRAKRKLPKGMAQPERKDDFLIRRWQRGKSLERDARLATDGPWLRLAASDTLLQVVNSYRGVHAKLLDIDCWYTVPFPDEYERVASQRWHRDPEDLNVVKCFVYFTDVDEEAGPFEYVPGSTKGGPYGDLWGWGESDSWYPPQEELEQKVPAQDRLLVTAPARTVVLCDTSGFHRGGHARSRPRILETHTYASPRSTWGRRFEVDWSDAPLSELARYALS